MSEYWKSTPKYWCKHCKTFVRDTKPERTNHEATPRHQGNIKRFIRDLHRGNEREERDKQRAKDEVDRLNGVVSGNSSASSSSRSPWQRKPAITSTSNEARQATPAERKQQLAQLAAMGVAVPEDFRREMAMAGDWQTVSERPVDEGMMKEEDEKDVKPSASEVRPAAVNIGVRKRKYEGQEEEEEAGEQVIRKGWGSSLRTYRGVDEETDLDALLGGTSTASHKATLQPSTAISSSGAIRGDGRDIAGPDNEPSPGAPLIKKEEPDSPLNGPIRDGTDTAPAKIEEPSTGIVFKKRRPKQLRQK